jgi:hypothetical protein
MTSNLALLPSGNQRNRYIRYPCSGDDVADALEYGALLCGQGSLAWDEYLPSRLFSKGQQVSRPSLKSGALLWQIFVSIVNRGYSGTVAACVSKDL